MAGLLNKQSSADSFNGVLAPVFTCFRRNPDTELELEFILDYAKWLKNHHIRGVMVNSIAGEGPALGLNERKQNAEAWCAACEKCGLLTLLQVGGAPLPDVLELAAHANTLKVHGVVLLPELFYKPRSIDQLVGYCKIVAKQCGSRPFMYYHIPRFTGVDFDMSDFCDKANDVIPNFLGLVFDSLDLDMGSRCLRKGRVVMLGDGKLLASAMMLGFESAIPLTANILPDMLRNIYNNMRTGNLENAKQEQKRLITLVRNHASNSGMEGYVSIMKNWFNDEMTGENGGGFSAGLARKLF